MNNLTANNADKLMRVLVFALIFSVMNGTMFNVALPMIGQEFNLYPSEVSWVMTSYMVLYAIGSVVYGKLADRYRLKDLLTFGLLLFAVGSFVGMLASDFWMIVVGRVLQAAGAGVLPATAMIIPIRYFAPEKRGRALGTSAVGLALGGALGPVVAGLISSFGSWRLLFLFSLISLITLPFFRKYLGEDKKAEGQLDILGGSLLAGTIALLLLAITQGYWPLFIAGATMLALFIVRIRNSSNPFVQPAIFANRSFSIGLFIVFLSTSMNFGLTFMTPQYLDSLNQLSPGKIGFVLFPAAAVAAMLGRKGGQFADERGNTFVLTLAASLMVLCYAMLSSFVGSSPYIIAVILIAGNVGQTFMQISMSNTISRILPKEQVGVGMGLFSMLNFISGAISMSVIGKLLDTKRTSLHFNPLVMNENAYVYSNIFIVMCVMTFVILLLYRAHFGAAHPKASTQ